jgi:selenocysteine lyase/cysteine desulfurase
MLRTERNDTAEVRRAFPALAEMTYLNVATHGLTPQPVLDRYLELISRTAHYGHMIYKAEEVPTLRRARMAIAGILNVPPSWVAFGRNATDGINYVFGSLTWQPSDEVIISDQEHPALFLPPEYGARRGLYTVRTFSADPDPEVTLRNLEAQISPRTRLIACSSVSSQTGIRLPSQAICALAQRHNDAGRERAILTLIDGTQEVGQWRVDVPAIGCDFYVSNGHKWLGGPKGSGILVVRDRAFSLLTPPYMAGGIDEGEHSIEDMLGHRNAPTLFESGTQNNAVVAVLADAVEWLDGLGWSWVEDRERALAGYLRERLRTLPGATLLTPDAWERSSAITSFSIEGLDAQHIQQTLWEQRIITRHVPERNGIRIATPYFTAEEELDRLIAALRAIAAAG